MPFDDDDDGMAKIPLINRTAENSRQNTLFLFLFLFFFEGFFFLFLFLFNFLCREANFARGNLDLDLRALLVALLGVGT